MLSDNHHSRVGVCFYRVAPVVHFGYVAGRHKVSHPDNRGDREAPAPRHTVVAICQQGQLVARLSRNAHLVIPSWLRAVSSGVELHLDGKGEVGVAANNVAQVTLTVLLDIALERELVSPSTKLVGEYLDDFGFAAHAL